MPRVLYNKYRSSDFDQLVGQEHITKILKNAVKSDKISHAYLFVGSRGTGKTSTARILAKALNCTDLSKDGNPCSQCDNCKAIEQGRFLDLIEIDAASNRGIDQIRELKEKLEFSPVEGRYKIYIVDEVHMLTKEAFNALLKTLEEPPKHIIFMLATTDVHKLPPTILSRCQRYDFRLGTSKEITKLLQNVSEQEGVKIDPKALDILVESAHGSFRDSLSLLDVVVSGQITSDKPEDVSESEVRKILGIPDSTMVYYLLDNLIKGDGIKVLDLITELESKGINLHQFIKYSLTALQNVLIRKIKGEEEKEYTFAKDITTNDVVALTTLFLQTERNLKNAIIPSLIIEMLIPQVEAILKIEKPNVPQKKVSNVEIKEEKIEKPEIKPEPQIIKEEIKQEKINVKPTKDIKFEQIESEWKKVIEGVRPANGHLFAFLGGAKLLNYENGVLQLEVPFEFHKERIESANGREAIHKALIEIFGTSFKIDCTVNGSVKRKKQVSADIILQNIPPKQTTTTTTDKPVHKVSKKIEAIFDGM